VTSPRPETAPSPGAPSAALPSVRLFLLLVFGWSWVGILGAVVLGGEAGHPLHLIGLLGPAVAWLCAVHLRTPPAYRRAFWRRLVDARAVEARWWWAVAAVGAGPALLGTGLALLAGRETTPGAALLPASVAGVVAFALAAGLAEEPGWRGVAQDGLSSRLGTLRAALVLGILWSAWHLPLYLLDGTYHADLGLGTSEFWASVAGPLPLAVLLVWLVAGTRGVLVPAVAAHALGNAVGELLPDSPEAAWAGLAATTAGAVAVAVAGRVGRPYGMLDPARGGE
jgi:uncharacterized protein